MSDGAIFRCGHLERIPLGTSYVGIVQHVARLVARLPQGTQLAIDFTGVGRPVADMFAAAGLSATLVLITGGTSDTYDRGVIGVPKLSLVSRVQALLHEGRLKIHKDLAEAAELVRELQDFRVEFTAAGSITFNARSGRHDDLVLALAIATWLAYGSGRGMNVLHFYRQQAAALRGIPEPMTTVVGVDLGQARDPTAIAVVQRVPARRIEERRHERPIVYALGSLERAEQDARRAATPTSRIGGEKWRSSGRGADASD
jgi:hypothetical protein